MVETELVTFISQFGFPIAVSVYVLVRLENTLKKNTEAITGLKIAIVENTTQDRSHYTTTTTQNK
jgi:hypothetical protein